MVGSKLNDPKLANPTPCLNLDPLQDICRRIQPHDNCCVGCFNTGIAYGSELIVGLAEIHLGASTHLFCIFWILDSRERNTREYLWLYYIELVTW